MRHYRLAALTAGAALAFLLVGPPASAGAAPGDREWHHPDGWKGMPTAMALDPASHDLLVALNVSHDRDNLVTRVDGASGAVEWQQAMPAGTTLEEIRVDPEGGRIVSVGSRYDYPDRQLFLEARDPGGVLLWQHDLSPWAEDNDVDDLAIDEETGLACALASGRAAGSTRLWSTTTTCVGPDGTVAFAADQLSSPDAEGAPSLAIDSRTHRVLVAGYGPAKGPRPVLTAYSADGVVVWRRTMGKGRQVHDVLVDPRRGRVHVVASHPRSGRALLIGYDTDGRRRFSTPWDSPTRIILEPEAAGVLPDGRVVVASLAANQLVVRTIAPSGRTVASMRARRARMNPHITVDERRGGVVMTANYDRKLHTTAFTRDGRVRWQRTRPAGGHASHAVLDEGAGRYVMADDSTRRTHLVAYRN